MIFLLLSVSFMITCTTPLDPFESTHNALGAVELSSPGAVVTDSILYDSTQSPISLRATLFLPQYIDSGLVTVGFEDGTTDTILHSLFHSGDKKDYSSIDTVLSFLRGGKATVRITCFIRGGFTRTDSAGLLLFCKPISLSSLSLENDTLKPAFIDTTTAYEASVENQQSDIRIVPFVDNPHATIIINDDTLHADSLGRTCALNVGDNVFVIRTVADDNRTEKSYTITVTRRLATVASLDSIIFAGVSINPSFTPEQLTGYTVTVEDTVDSISMHLYPAHAEAKMSIDDSTYVKGNCRFSVPLHYGDNQLNAYVKAQDTVTKKLYQVTVHRKRSSDAFLDSIILEKGILFPVFHKDSTRYTVTIAHEVDTLKIRPLPSHGSAWVRIKDRAADSETYTPVPLQTGIRDTIPVTLSAQDTKTTREYFLYVTRPQDTTSSLTGIDLSTAELTPSFDPHTLVYDVSIPFKDSALTLTARAADNNAQIKISATGSSDTIHVPTGGTTISITVTAEDRKTSTVYTLHLNRAKSSNATLKQLTPSRGALKPAFSADIREYTLTVGDTVAGISFSAIPRHDMAAISVNGASTDTTIALEPMSETPVSFVVTAEDGVTKHTYVVSVLRKGSSRAALSELKPSAGFLVPSFHRDSLDYELRVPSDSTLLRLMPISEHDRAGITVKGNTVDNQSWSGAISMHQGINAAFEVVVTSEDGKQQRSYSIRVNRAYIIDVSCDEKGSTTPQGTVDIHHGVEFPIDAEAAQGYYFDRWQVTDGEAITENALNSATHVLARSSCDIKALFLPIPYQITVTSNIDGGPSVIDTLLHNVTDTLITVASPGYHFVRWETVEGQAALSDSTDMVCAVTLTNGDAKIQAVFSPDVYTVALSAGEGGHVDGPESVEHGHSFAIEAEASPGYRFVKWEVIAGEAAIVDLVSANTDVVMSGGDASIAALFEPKVFALTITSKGSGRVDGPDSLAFGDSGEITAHWPAGSRFAAWRVTEGDAIIADTTEPATSISMGNSDASVIGIFQPKVFDLQLSVEGQGSVHGSGSVTYGVPAPITASAERGYYFSRWEKVSGTLLVNNTSADSTSVVLTQGDAHIQAIFEPYTEIYVDSAAGGAETGLSWENAFTDLQHALACANDGSTIHIAQGTYYPDDSDRDVSFSLSNGIRLIGGYGSGGSPDEGQTVLSGEIQEDADPSNNSATILSGENVHDIVIRDITIQGGYGQQGSGATISGSTVLFVSCRLQNNFSSHAGGAVFASRSNLRMISCTISGNNVYNEEEILAAGGAIYLESSDFDALECNFASNSCQINNSSTTSRSLGGAIYANGGSVTLNSSSIAVNTSTCNTEQEGLHFTFGGGVYGEGLDQITIFDCSFHGNESTGKRCFGGALSILNSTIDMQEAIFTSNMITASETGFGAALYLNNTAGLVKTTEFNSSRNESDIAEGGAVYVCQNAPSFSDCFFVQNRSIASDQSRGAAMMISDCSPRFDRCTFIANSAFDGGAVHAVQGDPIFFNCTFYLNDGDRYTARFEQSSPSVIHCTFLNNNSTGQIYAPDGGIILNSIFWTENEYVTILGGADMKHCFIKGYSGPQNDIFTDDPLLESCGDNGGKVPTVPIAHESPAKDKGSDDIPVGVDAFTDARGVERSDGMPDIGAFEVE